MRIVPCESLTTIVVAPPARAPRIAAFTSSAIIFRERPYSAPAAESWSDAEIPLIPSMSAEMKTLRPGCVVGVTPSSTSVASVAKVRLIISLLGRLYEIDTIVVKPPIGHALHVERHRLRLRVHHRASRGSFITFALTRSRCARDL